MTISDKLAEIGHAAFFGCENISGTLVLPASVYFIDERAFAGCSIDTFQVRRIDPIVYRLYMFYPGVTVKVPASAVSKYKAAPSWDI